MKFVTIGSALFIFLVLATLECRPVLGQDQGVTAPPITPPPNAATETTPPKDKNANGKTPPKDPDSALNPDDQWRSYGFGVAVTYTHDLGGHDRVKNAQVVNGVVRITEDNNALPRIMLETHYFFKPTGKLFGLFDSVKNSTETKVWGHGPFVGIQPGSQNIIEAVAIGWMVGLRRPDPQNDSLTANSSFNLGIGFVVDPNVQVLGDGVTKNQALPVGETQVRFKDSAQYGLLLMSSFSF